MRWPFFASPFSSLCRLFRLSRPAPPTLLTLPALLSLSALLAVPTGCLVDQGNNIVAPNINLDEDFFFCRVQPDVISATGCASGGSLGGSCHGTSVSSLRFDVAAETDPRPDCVDGAVVGAVPASYERNLEAARFTVQIDPQSSTLYTSPTGVGSHPRVIFQEDSVEAQIIAEWINGGAR